MTRRRWLLAAAYAVLAWPAIDYVRWHRTSRCSNTLLRPTR